MNNENETYYLIDQYLKGELPTAQVQEVEALLKSDPSFAATLQEQQMLNDVIEGASMADLRAQMSADIEAIDQTVKPNKTKYYIIGVGLVAALSLTYVLWPSEEKSVELIQEQEETSVQPERVTETSTTNSSTTTPSPASAEEVVQTTPNQEEVVMTEQTENSTEEAEDKSEVEATKEIPVASNESSTPAPDENKEYTEIEDICKRTTMTVDVDIEKACTSEQNGAIVIKSISGGEAPYTVFDKNSSDIIKNNSYEGLSSGKYELYIVDANSCIHEFDYIVPTKNCSGESVVIDLNAGQGWEIPSSEPKLTIFNTGGQLVFEKPAGTKIKEWMGLDKNGTPLAAGTYIYKMEYPEGKIVTGQINVMQ